MNFKSIALTGAAVVALGFTAPAFAGATKTETTATTTTETTAPSGAEVGAAKAGTNIEKSVGAKDAFTQEDAASAVALASVDRSAATLESAKVDDPSGAIIGTVKHVKHDKNGKVAALHVDVGSFLGVGGRVVEVPAGRFSYLPKRNILVTNLTKAEVEKLPPVAMNPTKDTAG
ncbi:MAG: PRC-barrel domain-containing protein [Caulobacterales bacterium]